MRDVSYYEYIRLIEGWKKQYGVIDETPLFDPARLRIACVKCDRIRKRMERHHTGNDLFFAKLMPDAFAADYVRFRPEDTARVCDDCHKQVHKFYKPITKKLWEELNSKGLKIVTKAWCIRWMSEYRAAFARWVKQKPRKRRRKRNRRLVTKREAHRNA